MTNDINHLSRASEGTGTCTENADGTLVITPSPPQRALLLHAVARERVLADPGVFASLDLALKGTQP